MTNIVASVLPLCLDLLIRRHQLRYTIDHDIAIAHQQLQLAHAASNEDARRIEELHRLVYEIEVNIDLYNIDRSRFGSREQFQHWLNTSLFKLETARGEITTPLASQEPEDLGVLLAQYIKQINYLIDEADDNHPNGLLKYLKKLLRRLFFGSMHRLFFGSMRRLLQKQDQENDRLNDLIEQLRRLLENQDQENDPLNDLIELLRPLQNQDHQDKLRVISIVGPGGVGKTHLSGRVVLTAIIDIRCRLRRQEVMNQEGSYDVVAFIHAADKADENILRELLNTIPPRDEADTTSYNNEELKQRLRLKLRERRYLVVVDDVRKQEQWDNIKSALPDDGPSRVIVTTTIQSVANACIIRDNVPDMRTREANASIIPGGYVYKMRTLDAMTSASLFIRKLAALSTAEVVTLFAEGLLQKCEGLPLALVSTAQLVRHRNKLEFCEDIHIHLGEYLETQHTLKKMQCVLARMYNSLEDPLLKACLLYFCTLKFAYPVSRNSIIRQWIAEGFVDPPARSKGPLLTEQYKKLETLIDRNIIGHTEVSNNGKVKRCRPSGMVLEYISHKSEVEKFVTFNPSSRDEDTCIRRLSLHNNPNGFCDFGKSYPQTLVISEDAAEKILSFRNCELVKVLDLENCSNLENRHIRKICDLSQLIYLSLGRKVTSLPRKIQELKKLETLDLRKTRVDQLPIEVIIHLPELIHLLGKFELLKDDYNQRTEDWLSENGNRLETLAGFITRRNRGFPQLMRHMKRLQKVKIWIESDADDKNCSALSKAIKEYVSRSTDELGGIRSLSIRFEAELPPSFLMDPESSPVNGSLQSLKLRGPREQLSQILSCFTKVNGIKELCLRSTTTFIWDGDVLDNLKVLLYLKLEAVQAGDIQITIEPDKFKALSRMCLKVVNGNLPGIRIDVGAMKSLYSLHLICTDLDAALAVQIQRLPRLREVRLHSSGVTEATKGHWRTAAQRHPNKPNVLFTG